MSYWYLDEWLQSLGKKQADVAIGLNWNKAKISLLSRGLQQFTGADLVELAHYLEIEPFELLMHPTEAVAQRKLQEAALLFAQSSVGPPEKS